jgi:hypothetical protein
MISFRVDVSGKASPKIRKIARDMPDLIDSAVRMVVAVHRRRLQRYMTQNVGGFERKKMLDAKGLARLTDNPVNRRKHEHRSDRPFSGANANTMQNAVRYIGKGYMHYGYGFTGGAQAWMERLAEGLFMDPKTKVVGNNVTQSMRDYFDSIGLPLKKKTTTINMKKRPVVEAYFKANHKKMERDFRGILFKKYNKLMAELRIA